MTRRHCPTCWCDAPARLVIDPCAPFYGLVVEADRLIYDDYIDRRTATRHANQIVPAPVPAMDAGAGT